MKTKHLFLPVALLMLGACSETDNGSKLVSNEYKPLSLPVSQSRVADLSNNFGIKIFDAALNLQPGENVLISPLNANIVLSMITNGADGYTLQELTDVLGFANDISALNEYNKTILGYLPTADKTAELYLPNSFWFTSDVYKSDFKSQLSNYYSAEIKATSDDDFTTDINDWVNQKTRGKITDILKAGEKAPFAFVNCLYFNGTWSVAFDKLNTEKGEFKNLDGTVSNIDFMKREAIVRNGGGDNYSAISYPFGNEAFTLDIYLADEGYTTDDVIENISTDGLCGFGYKNAMYIQFPKFAMKRTSDLIPVLESIGIRDVFQDGADLSRMRDDLKYKLSVFRQANAVEFSETGVEAASSTVAAGETIGFGPVLESFVVDRPFIFMVREQSTGAILLAGRIVKF